MPVTRLVWLLVGVATLGLIVGCAGGGDTPAEDETATGAVAESGLEDASEAGLEEASEAGDESGGESDLDVSHPLVEFRTNLGTIELELYPDKAPRTVDNFLGYVREGFYDGTIFHRVVPNFVIQGGGFTRDMTKKDTDPPIENEADNGLRNLRGAICMARTNDPHSASSQFFINTKDNPPLDFRGKTPSGWGYAVFGKVVEGMDVVDVIEKVPTGRSGPYQDVPLEPVVIETARIVS